MNRHHEQTVHGLSARYDRSPGVHIGRGRTLCLSRQGPVRSDGSVPPGFWEQAQLAWDNIESDLHAVGMGLADIVEHTVFVVDRRHVQASDDMQRKVLGSPWAARSVVVASERSALLLEIEVKAIAARGAASKLVARVPAPSDAPARPPRERCRGSA